MTATAEQPDPAAVLADRELRASLAHDEWANAMRRAGWRYGPALDMPGLMHPNLVPFDQLGDVVRAAKLDAVPLDVAQPTTGTEVAQP